MPLVVVNPAAGGGRVARLWPRIRDLAEHRARVVFTAGPGEAAGIVREAREERVIAVGGDGTVHEVLSGLRPDQALGVVPLGSGNDFARMLGVHRLGPKEALVRALSAPVRRVDLGVANGRPFAASFGVGFDAAVARRALGAPRFLKGMPRYLYALFLELWGLELPRLTLSSLGRTLYTGPFLLAALMNGPTYGGGMPIAPHADPADGRLEAVVAGRFSRLGVLGVLPRLLGGRHLDHPEVRAFSASSFTLDFDREVWAHADGEPLGAARRFEVRVVPEGLRVLA